jgi:hypothetical protein
MTTRTNTAPWTGTREETEKQWRQWRERMRQGRTGRTGTTQRRGCGMHTGWRETCAHCQQG